jgi:hypothetical protein
MDRAALDEAIAQAFSRALLAELRREQEEERKQLDGAAGRAATRPAA